MRLLPYHGTLIATMALLTPMRAASTMSKLVVYQGSGTFCSGKVETLKP